MAAKFRVHSMSKTVLFYTPLNTEAAIQMSPFIFYKNQTGIIAGVNGETFCKLSIRKNV